VAIDTAGLTRSKSIHTDVDFYSMHRAQRSIRRADVVLLFFDASQPISRVDKQLCEYIYEQIKPCVFVVNKWDLYAGKVATEEWAQYLHDTFRSMTYVPIAFVTGMSGKNVKTLVNHAQMLFKQARERVSTAELNRVLRAVVEKNPPSQYKNQRAKIFFATQVGTEPPTIVIVSNDPQAISPNYQTYLMNALRERLPYSEIPIRLYLRDRKSGEGAPDAKDDFNVDDENAASYDS
jgi:GTP-binding protein